MNSLLAAEARCLEDTARNRFGSIHEVGYGMLSTHGGRDEVSVYSAGFTLDHLQHFGTDA